MNRKYYSKFYGNRQLQTIYRFFQETDELWRSRKATHVAYPTLCVGNFQAGGTGKTPSAIWLAQQLAGLGYAPSIVLRGHKGSTNKPKQVQSTDTAQTVGDEALLHAQHFPTFIGKNRVAACQLAVRENNASKPVLIVDDGLQHYPLLTDFKIVCTKGVGFWNDVLLPLGRLRQIPHTRIDAIFLIEGKSNIETWEGVPVYAFEHAPQLISGTTEPGLMVCGLGQPHVFFDQVFPKIGNTTFDSWSFKDHHAFTARDLKRIEAKSKIYTYRVHCTAKDAVKLEPLIKAQRSPIALSVWDVQPKPVTNVKSLLAAVVSRIEEVYTNRPHKGSEKA